MTAERTGGDGAAAACRRALVVFRDQAGLWWLRLLKPGFRHCFVALGAAECWVVIDPLSHRTEVAMLSLPAGFDLAEAYRSCGLTVLEVTPVATPCRMAPLRPYSCVEAVKRVLGIHAGWVLTPWQLYRYLTREGRANERSAHYHEQNRNNLLTGAHW